MQPDAGRVDGPHEGGRGHGVGQPVAAVGRPGSPRCRSTPPGRRPRPPSRANSSTAISSACSTGRSPRRRLPGRAEDQAGGAEPGGQAGHADAGARARPARAGASPKSCRSGPLEQQRLQRDDPQAGRLDGRARPRATSSRVLAERVGPEPGRRHLERGESAFGQRRQDVAVQLGRPGEVGEGELHAPAPPRARGAPGADGREHLVGRAQVRAVPAGELRGVARAQVVGDLRPVGRSGSRRRSTRAPPRPRTPARSPG